MSVKEISTNELRTMKDKAGIIFQDCNDEPQVWVKGINDLLTEDNILLEGTRLEEVSSFKHEGSPCLLFEFKDDDKIDMGKLAIWRIKTHHVFGGTWLDDFVNLKLSGFIQEKTGQVEKRKPDCALIGENGNIYNLVGIASRTLKDNGLREEAEEMSSRALSAGDYYKALGIIEEYVNITSEEDMDEGMEMTM